MSMETHVFFRGPLPRKSALRRVMRELGFPFTLVPDTGPLEGQSGFMPMRLRGEDTGVEFDVFEGREAIDEFSVDGIDPAFDRCANFRWGGDETEMLAGLCAAAALAKLVDGVVFDEAEDRLLTVDEAVAVAQKNLAALRRPEEPKHPGTRPADIKRYLKPLLKLRPDLVLCGRHLLVRPVRHVMRGAFFDRTIDKYEFRLFRFINPLFGDADGGFGGSVYDMAWKVWQPYFLPLLLDTLAEDIFEHVGPVTSLSGLADWMSTHKHHHTALIRTLILTGDRDRAIALVDDVEREEAASPHGNSAWIENQRALLARNVESICEEAHRDEAASAKVLKLGNAWEPSPFPVELPVAKRRSVDEPAFATAPWPAKTAGLVIEPPSEHGEVRFAEKWLTRDGHNVLLAPLTREQAGRKHANREEYILFVRLAADQTLFLQHWTRWSPHDFDQPRNPNYVPKRDYWLRIYTPERYVLALFHGDFDDPDRLEMWSVEVQESIGGKNIWHSYNDLREDTITIYRGSPHAYEERALTAEEKSLCLLAPPPCGDFESLLTRAKLYLEVERVGSLI